MPPTDVNQALKFRSGGGGGHGAYNQRIKVIAKMLKKCRLGVEGGGCQGGYEQRIEVIVKIAKKSLGGSVQSRDGGQSGCERRKCKKKKKKKRFGRGPL